MEFKIMVEHDRKKIRLAVKRIYQSTQIERYEVIAGNGSLILQCNWPVLRARGLRRRHPAWKIYKGHLPYMSLVEQIIKAVERGVRSYNPSF